MRKAYIAILALALLSPRAAMAQAIGGNISSVAVSGTTSRVALTANTLQYPALLITPAVGSSVGVFYKLGTSAVVATTSDNALPIGGICVNVGPNTNLASITASGTATINLTQLTNCPIFSGNSPSGGGGGGSGTVTSVSVATANGFSGTVNNATTTPAISIIAGAITPTTVNGVTIASGTGTLSLGTSTITAGVSGTIAVTSQLASLPLSMANGGFGAANVITFTQPATAATVTIVNNKTFTVNNTLTLAGTDGSTLTVGTGGTLGTAAFVNTGTNGGTVPLLNAANTWSAIQTAAQATTTSPGWYSQLTGDAVPRVRVGLNATDVGSIAFGDGTNPRDVFLERVGAGALRHGAPDAAAPVAQSILAQNVVAGTSNTAGASFTFKGSQGTGTGIGGSWIFQVATAGTTGTTQNALATALTIDSTKLLTAPGALAIGGATIGPNALAVAGTSFLSLSGGDSPTTNIITFNSTDYGIRAYFGYVFPISNVNKYWLSSAGVTLASDKAIAWDSSTVVTGNTPDLFIRRDAANTLAQRNGATAQTQRIYGSFIDASNGDWLELNKAAAGAAYVRTVKNGTGVASTLSLGVGGANFWTVDASGNFSAVTDNASDIGATGANRPRNLFVAGTVTSGTLRTATAYIVSTLPAAGSAGRRAYVTDQLTACVATGVALTGGGSVVCPVFDNGVSWVGG